MGLAVCRFREPRNRSLLTENCGHNLTESYTPPCIAILLFVNILVHDLVSPKHVCSSYQNLAWRWHVVVRLCYRLNEIAMAS